MAVATETRARLESPPYEAYAAIMGTFIDYFIGVMHELTPLR